MLKQQSKILSVILIALVVSVSVYGVYIFSVPKDDPTPTITPTSTPTKTSTPTPQPTSMTITDVNGENITIPLPVNRIVCITSGITDIIYSLGAIDKLVGRDSYSTFPEDILTIPVVAQSSSSPSIELIAELNPDLVIADTMLSDENIETIRNLLGVPLLIDVASQSDRVVPLVQTLGEMLGKEETAAKLILFMNNITNIVTERLANLTDSQRPIVYYEWSKAWFSCNNNSLPHQMIITAGGKNLAANQSSTYPTLSPEYVAESNPEIIIRMISSPTHNVT
ncbi:MAG: ABC transporter substrate-binding protein, partial [Crenarchaeota archaeon]|nr:ABC transporter substrate-binding protein [Thermoproteota archaeon]